MTIKAVVFDIGGVLEIAPPLGITEQWEHKLDLPPGELDKRLIDVWREGSYGRITIDQVHQRIGEIMGMSDALVNAFMDDIWKEYLGTLNVELADYFRGLRPQYQTAIISNSFAGAREQEAIHYQFDTIADFIIYSHEVGIAKPDKRIFEMTWQRLGIEPAEMIFVDDVEVLVNAARELDIQAIQHRENAQTIAEISALLQSG